MPAATPASCVRTCKAPPSSGRDYRPDPIRDQAEHGATGEECGRTHERLACRKEMGAGVAASPHCPAAGVTKPGRRGSPPWAFSRIGPEPGAREPISGVLRKLALRPVSPLAPRQGRSPGGSPLGRSGTGVPIPAVSGLCRSIGRQRRVSMAEAWVSASAVHELASWVCRFAAPGPKPGPARRLRSRSSASTGGSALTFIPLLPDSFLAEAGILPVGAEPESSEPGRLTTPAT
jgi:hypothetical protein